MASSDALLVTNDWISEFYFTADQSSGTFLAAVKNLVKEWKAEAEEDSGWVSPLDRFTSSRQRLLSELITLHSSVQEVPEEAPVALRRAKLAEGSTAIAAELREIFDYRGNVEEYGPLRIYSAPGIEQPTVAVIDALAVDSVEELVSARTGFLPEDVVFDTETNPDPLKSVAEVMSALISHTPSPTYVVVFAGRHVLLTSTGTNGWAEGRYLSVDLQTVAERGDVRSGGETQRAVAAVSGPSLIPNAQGEIWWDARREESVRNAVGVSADLRDGVRESIEIIANEVVNRRKAQGLDPLANDQAQVLAVQSLRYLFRVLFLLYAEASPRLGVVPTGDPDYESGYSIDRLRELTIKPLTTSSLEGRHFYESLQLLFHLVETGHTPRTAGEDQENPREGLTFEAMRSDLFRPNRTSLIDEVKLGNKALQKVLQNLLLTKETRGRNRGFISYVALGINQLGAVYESLMSYTGSFASEELVEVAPHGDASNGSWVVPERRLDEDLKVHCVEVLDEEGRPHVRRYQFGEFVFRLSGRERQRSASYYSPKVLTEFTVQQGLDELLTEDTTAQEILDVSVCEPALGSGAFAIEAVNQLAAAYLERRQREVGRSIDPDEYPQEFQKAKTYIALHNVYGVDLNPTAVELAEVSLWLDTMARGLKAPWFGLRLRSGNSLIGARHAVYSASTVEKAKPKDRMEQAPHRIPLSQSPAGDGIFHFLLPASGWGTAGGNNEIKKLAPEQAKDLSDWAKRVAAKPTKAQVKELVSLSERIQYLWGIAERRMIEAERQSRRSIDVWEAEVPAGGEVTREEIEKSLREPNSAYRRLRLVMDAWCALWFWPVLTDGSVPAPPEFEEWLTTIRLIVGSEYKAKKSAGQESYFGRGDDEWEALDDIELMFTVEGCENVEKLLDETPWLREAQRIAKEQRFFHWELDFAAVFARGGFDLQVGNPPWVRPRPDVAALLGESDPWWTLNAKPSEAAKRARRPGTLAIPGAEETLLLGLRDTVSLAEFISDAGTYPELAGTQPDLYRTFMSSVWQHASSRGTSALVHPPTHFTDAKGYTLRRHTYRHLRRHWGFINELQLFGEVDHHLSYSVNVYGSQKNPRFLNTVNIYHPSTASASLVHNGDGPEPGFKDDEGNWDLRPHRSRIQRVELTDLAVWHQLMEGGDPAVPVESARMVYSVNESARDVLSKLTNISTIGSIAPQFSRGWDETGGRRDGYFESRWGPAPRWKDVILQGPYFHVGNPFFQSRNSTMGGNQDYSRVDLERLSSDALPITEYKPIYGRDEDGNTDMSRYDNAYGSWEVPGTESGTVRRVPVRDFYRVMWRAMAASTGERTLISSIYPPGTATINGVLSAGITIGHHPNQRLALMAAAMTSLTADFLTRSTTGNNIFLSAVERVPRIPEDHPLASAAVLRILRLNALTDAYADLWADCWRDEMARDSWTGGNPRHAADSDPRPELGDVGPRWTSATPLRVDEDRRQALVEIDAIMAHVTGISIDELCTTYRTQFGVLYAYDRGEGRGAYIYDAAGRVLPSTVRTAWNKAGRPETGMPEEDRTYVNPEGRTLVAQEPFRILDREEDMRTAYREFAPRLNHQDKN
ncbi:Eco57I restriction-modification methylase domain-containing protein [Kocuria massiliensis]|uniref:Eco57I restriction-modification methylase domain-containing protein n=1 Tax=Kocuria massiliensis TaxID=1926282 RepID=UPI0022B9B150|nr:restriction endonuclease [Kocuria massiliensis]